MRIQNNITAMNTHRQYTINNDNVAKSAEKLASGYRINRAGDDAAGLAISEKMRSQIRGLNMATKNSQDAISLVQTAEGALQETHAMLQRMNELAVQAATGTNETLDRAALSKEFEQLKREINDVAEQTNFNNMKILDGSLSYTGFVRSAATSGITVSKSDLADVGGIDLNGTEEAKSLGFKADVQASNAKITLTDDALLEASTNDVEYELTFGTGTDAVKVKFTGDGTSTLQQLATGQVSGKTPTVSDGWSVSAGPDNSIRLESTVPGSKGLPDNVPVTIKSTTTGDTGAISQTQAVAPGEKASGVFTSDGVKAALTTGAPDKTVSPQEADKPFKITFSNGTVSTDVNITLTDKAATGAPQTLHEALNGKLVQLDGHNYQITADANGITLTDTQTHENAGLAGYSVTISGPTATTAQTAATVTQGNANSNPPTVSEVKVTGGTAGTTAGTGTGLQYITEAGKEYTVEIGNLKVNVTGVSSKTIGELIGAMDSVKGADGTTLYDTSWDSGTGALTVRGHKPTDTTVPITAGAVNVKIGENTTAAVDTDPDTLKVGFAGKPSVTTIENAESGNGKLDQSVTAGQTYRIGFKDNAGKEVGFIEKTASADDVGKTVAQLLGTGTVEINGTTFSAGVADGKLTLTNNTTNAATTVKSATVSVSTPADVDRKGAVDEGRSYVAGNAAQEGVQAYTFDFSKLKDGDTLTINGKVYTVGNGDGQISRGDNGGSMKTFVDNLKLAVAKDSEVRILENTDADGKTIGFKVSQTTTGNGENTQLNGDTAVHYKAGSGKSSQTTVEFDAVKLKDGDRVSVTIGNNTYEYTVKEGDTATAVMQGLRDVNDSKQALRKEDGEIKGNAIIVKGENVDVESGFKARPEDPNSFNAIRIQVGALENEQLAVSIDSMNTAGLRLDGQNLDSQDAAGRAITATRNAINKVSDQRATLGAMQNRLDHKIANLKVASENLSASESRIRDVDMAQEMTNFTKNNILSQAATAMLAQANSLPQNVLSLLG